MGTFRSTYPTTPESNQGPPISHFAWFHPGNYMAATRAGFNPFRGTQLNPDGISAVPLRSVPCPMTEAANIADPDTEPSKPAKKQKTPKKEGKPKKPSKSKKVKASVSPSGKRERKNLNFASYESKMDASGAPAPVCTCTGVPRQCYRWGSGGWQSSCCTTSVSEYPLPMSTTRPGSRMAGRKMSNGAYDKLLQRLAGEGFDLAQPVDLKDHWAKHGTNKFVTIK